MLLVLQFDNESDPGLVFDGECTSFLAFEVGLALVLLFDSKTITLLSFRLVPTVERRFAGFLLTWRVYFA